jgi:hypothetical protein
LILTSHPQGEAAVVGLCGWRLVCLAVVAGVATEIACGAEPSAAETKKIEALIAHVEGLKETKFVRNGIEYDAKTAAAFLRGKWDTNKAKIKTAEDFIEHVATKSSTSGKPYLIRYPDGKEVKSGEYLREQLKKLAMTPLERGG